MPDIKLVLNPSDPNYGDLDIENNDLILSSGAEEVLQNVLQAIRFFYGEYFLNNGLGVPYFQKIMVKNPQQSDIDTILSDTIQNVPGVTVLQSYSFTPSYANRVLTVAFRAMTTNGPISYSGTIGG